MRKLLLDWDGADTVELTFLGIDAHPLDDAVSALADIYAPLGFTLAWRNGTRLRLVGDVQADDGLTTRRVRQLSAGLYAAGYVVCDDIPLAAA